MTHQPRITVMTGPGNHSAKLVDAIKMHGTCFEVFQFYPSFERQVYDEQGKMVYTKKNKPGSSLARYVWAICIRIPFLKKRNYHTYYNFVIYDKWVSKKFSSSSKLLWAWSQTGKTTMTRFKKNGNPVVLESPMIHAITWSSILEKEYLRHTGSKYSTYYFSEKLTKRMLDEYGLSDEIVTLSSFANETFIANGTKASKLKTVHLYAEEEIFTPRPKNKQPGFRLLFVGRIDILKGIPLLLKTFKNLQEKIPGFSLTLVGDVKPEVKNLIEGLPTITLTGTVSKTELANHYHNADLLVLPSVQESFGLVVLESIASGTRVLASTHSGGPDIAKENELVHVFNPENETEFEQKILHLYETRENTTTAKYPDAYSKKQYAADINTIIDRYLKAGA